MMDVAAMLEQLTLEDLQGRDCYMLAEVLGMEAFRRLVLAFGGSDPYIPKAESLVLPLRNELIAREYDGGNEFALSRKWGVSERYLRELVKDKTQELRARSIDGQMSLY